MNTGLDDGGTAPCADLLRRHPSLKPIARDHGTGLVCVQRLQKAIKASGKERVRLSLQIRSICQHVIASYLQDDYKILSAIVPPELIEGYSTRYCNLCLAMDKLLLHDPSEEPEADVLGAVADAIDDYVRWEERTLFPAIEEILPPHELEQLRKKTAPFDEAHARPTQHFHVSAPANEEQWLPSEPERPQLDPEL